jgi:hypothetical protein
VTTAIKPRRTNEAYALQPRRWLVLWCRRGERPCTRHGRSRRTILYCRRSRRGGLRANRQNGARRSGTPGGVLTSARDVDLMRSLLEFQSRLPSIARGRRSSLSVLESEAQGASNGIRPTGGRCKARDVSAAPNARRRSIREADVVWGRASGVIPWRGNRTSSVSRSCIAIPNQSAKNRREAVLLREPPGTSSATVLGSFALPSAAADAGQYFTAEASSAAATATSSPMGARGKTPALDRTGALATLPARQSSSATWWDPASIGRRSQLRSAAISPSSRGSSWRRRDPSRVAPCNRGCPRVPEPPMASCGGSGRGEWQGMTEDLFGASATAHLL